MSETRGTGRVVVLGAVNTDLVLGVDRLPGAGETVLATSVTRFSGGKGANQAVAAARFGAETAFLGAIGDDHQGQVELATLRRCGVDVSGVQTIAGEVTGSAFVLVASYGENSIVVAPGASHLIGMDRLRADLNRLCDERTLLVLQTEVSGAVVDSVATLSAERRWRYVLNNGPWVELDPRTLANADPLVLNESEALSTIGESKRVAPELLVEAVQTITGCRSVVVTFGEQGAQWGAGGQSGSTPAPAVDVVDSVGAGDTFIGTLAAHVARGIPFAMSVQLACDAAAEAVTWPGARKYTHV